MNNQSAITVSTNTSKLDFEFIHDFLTNIYWAKGRTREAMQTAIDNSLNFGIYLNKQQVGFARVLTDKVQLAYLLDVFIAEEHRGKGYSKILMQHIMDHPDVAQVQIWRLGTDTAHGLYEKFGFTPITRPGDFMEYKPAQNKPN